MKTRLCILFVLLACAGICVQGYRFGSFRHIDSRQGLPSNYVRAIDSDSTGLVWVGTTNGVATFDGYRVRKRPFRCGHDHDINVIDVSGRVPVVYTYDSVYELSGDMFVPVRKLRRDEPPVRKLPVDNGLASKTNSWDIDENGNFWLSVVSQGIVHMNRSGEFSYMNQDEYVVSYPGINTSAVMTDSIGLVWVGSEKNGLSWTLASEKAPAFRPTLVKQDVSFVHRPRVAIFL